MPADGFSFTGLDAVLARMEEWGDAQLRQLDQAVEETALGAVESAQADVRVDSGDLEASIAAHRVGWGHMLVSAGEGLGYARRVESIDAYFNPSIQQARDDLRRRVLATRVA